MTDFSSSTATEPALKRVEMLICEPCLNGVGDECHTPGCAMFLHRVDLPFPPDVYKVIPDPAQASHEGPARVEPVATVEHLPSTPSVDPAYAAKEPETTRNLRESLCDDCPPVGHYPDEGRCKLCPRRSTCIPSTQREGGK